MEIAYVGGMEDSEFDRVLMQAAFALAGETSWGEMTIAAASRRAGLPLDRARLRCPGKIVLLMRFGREADRLALGAATAGTPARDQLFDMLMRRIDVLQTHRQGVLALFRALPLMPLQALGLAAASERSMAWMIDAAGLSASGTLGQLRSKGLLAVWLWTVRAWSQDETLDLAPTMAALDQALVRAETAESWLGSHGRQSAAQTVDAVPMDIVDAAVPPPQPVGLPELPDPLPPEPPIA